MDSSDWLANAKELLRGQTRRVSHCGIGNDTAAVISHTDKGYSYFCFRCGNREYEPLGFQRAMDLPLFSKQLEHSITNSKRVELPHDITKEIPEKYACWFYKAGITHDTAIAYGIRFSPSLHRIIVPVYNHRGDLVYYQARAVEKELQKIKYINPRADRSSILWYSKSYKPDADHVVLVEDILSGIRVGDIQPCISLLGTKITTAHTSIIRKHGMVSIWLDPDKAGVEGSSKIDRRLSLLGVRTNIIKTDVDPKFLPNRKIKEILIESVTGIVGKHEN